jgi:hypothetical protein
MLTRLRVRGAQFGQSAILQHPARQDSRTATRLSSPKSCPTKPKLHIVDCSSRPRKRGAPHNQDVGEVGRTTTSNSETPVRLNGEEGTQKNCKRAASRVAQGLEGSRFTRWQLYGSVAGGSRELPSAMFCPSRLFCCGDTTAHRTAAPRDVPESRLLATDRAAMLRSGSPPGLRHATPCSLGERSASGAQPKKSCAAACVDLPVVRRESVANVCPGNSARGAKLS